MENIRKFPGDLRKNGGIADDIHGKLGIIPKAERRVSMISVSFMFATVLTLLLTLNMTFDL